MDPATGKLCIVGRLLVELPPPDGVDLAYLLASTSRYSARLVSRALTVHGNPVSKDAILAHRQESCPCHR